MNKTGFITGATLLVSIVCNQILTAAEMSAEESAIRQAAKEFTDAYDRGNAEAVAARWTPDGEYIIGDKTVKGRQEIARLYGEFLRSPS